MCRPLPPYGETRRDVRATAAQGRFIFPGQEHEDDATETETAVSRAQNDAQFLAAAFCFVRSYGQSATRVSHGATIGSVRDARRKVPSAPTRLSTYLSLRFGMRVRFEGGKKKRRIPSERFIDGYD